MTAGALLRERLAADPAALPFAEAVFAQLVGPAGALAGAPPAARDALAVHLADTLLAGARDPEAAAPRLLAEPPLAAAFFQNLDLLYASASPHADAISLLLMRALELAAEEDIE